MTDLREMDQFYDRHKVHDHMACAECLPGRLALVKNQERPSEQLMLHKRVETRINKLEQPVLGLKGGVDRQEVLKIIEEEFGRMDYLR